MQLNVTLSRVELRLLVQDLIPLEIDLHENEADRSLILNELLHLELVPDQGVRIEMSGELHWSVLGVPVSVPINSLCLLARMTHQKRTHANLVIELIVEKSDVAWLPGLVDKGIAERINHEIRARNLQVAWDFENLLTHTFAMPRALRSAENLGLRVRSSSFRVTESSVHLDVEVGAFADRRHA